MPEATIVNVKDVWGAPHFTPQGARVVWCNNNSAGTLFAGDVVILQANGIDVTTTTTANDRSVYGVVAPSNSTSLRLGDTTYDTYAVGALVPVVVSGPARINIAANTIVAKDELTCSGTAKVAFTNNTTTTNSGAVVAVALEADSAKDANNTIRCLVKSG